MAKFADSPRFQQSFCPCPLLDTCHASPNNTVQSQHFGLWLVGSHKTRIQFTVAVEAGCPTGLKRKRRFDSYLKIREFGHKQYRASMEPHRKCASIRASMQKRSHHQMRSIAMGIPYKTSKNLRECGFHVDLITVNPKP